MAALGIHQHRIDQMRIALPFEPGALGAARLHRCESQRFSIRPSAICGIALAADAARSRASSSQLAKGCSGDRSMRGLSSRATKASSRCAPFAEGQGAQILFAVHQQVIGADAGGKFRHQLGVGGLAVQPLLQIAEAARHGRRRRSAIRRRSRRRNSAPSITSGKAVRDILAGAAVKPALAAFMHGLHADAVPFPFRGIIARRHSARNRSASSIACASITGRKRAGASALGLSLRFSSQANRSS